jgi:hypothetical protein
MKNYLHKNLHPISTAIGRLHNFLLLKIQRKIGKQEDFRFYKKKENLTFFEIFEFILLFILVFNYLECFTLLRNI